MEAGCCGVVCVCVEAGCCGVVCVECGCCGGVCVAPGCGGLGFAAGGDARIADALFGKAGGAVGTALASPAVAWLLAFAACSSLCCSIFVGTGRIDGEGAGFGGGGIVALGGGDCKFAGGNFGAVGPVGGCGNGALWVGANAIAHAAGFAIAGSALGVAAAVCSVPLLVDSWGAVVLLLVASAFKFGAGLPSTASSPEISSMVASVGFVDVGCVASSVLTVGLAVLGLCMLGVGCLGVARGGGPGAGCLTLIERRGGGIDGAAMSGLMPVFALLDGWELAPNSNSRFTGTLGPDFVAVQVAGLFAFLLSPSSR